MILLPANERHHLLLCRHAYHAAADMLLPLFRCRRTPLSPCHAAMPLLLISLLPPLRH